MTDIIIHHSAGSPSQTPLDIDAEHRARGMDMIGYNCIIGPEGTVYSGRPLLFIPAAAYGRNAESINICVLGNFQSDDPGYTGVPTSAQIQSLTDLCVQLHHQHPYVVRTIGHRDVAPMFYPSNEGDYATACPGDKLYALLPTIKAAIQKAMASL
jgi:N-acetylmuramoyl-L-alanine amidase